MQNSSPNQMKMLVTRIGDNCKMVITGDLKQSDKLYDSGLASFINKLKQYNSLETTKTIKKESDTLLTKIEDIDILIDTIEKTYPDSENYIEVYSN